MSQTETLVHYKGGLIVKKVLSIRLVNGLEASVMPIVGTAQAYGILRHPESTSLHDVVVHCTEEGLRVTSRGGKELNLHIEELGYVWPTGSRCLATTIVAFLKEMQESGRLTPATHQLCEQHIPILQALCA